MLGRNYKIIEEGLNGRTTILDDPMGENRNGEEYFDVYTDERNEETTVTIGGPVMPQNTFDRF